MDSNPGYYTMLKSLSNDYPTPDFRQIEIDAIRSYAHVKNEKERKWQE